MRCADNLITRDRVEHTIIGHHAHDGVDVMVIPSLGVRFQ
jgi:hypothetical protein